MSKKSIAVLTGAGVSAESGLKTYRDNGGLWNDYDPMKVASVEGWNADPGLVLEFYNQRRAELGHTAPNEAHRLIAELENSYKVNVITQNVDNLHERAGSTNVLHLHGELTKIRPENTCNDNDNFSEEYVVDIRYGRVVLGDMAPNGAQYRPHIVFFGEAVPKMNRAIDIVSAADAIIIVGTSLSVYPAASLYRYASFETPVYLIDPAEMKFRDPRITHIRKIASEGMKDCLDLLR